MIDPHFTVRRALVMVSVLALAGGCASGGGSAPPAKSPPPATTAPGTVAPPAPLRAVTLGVDRPADRRDFSRIELVAPAMLRDFDPSLDAFGYDYETTPFTVEFTSGNRYHWPAPLDRMVQDALLREFSRTSRFTWVDPMPAREAPRFVLRVNIAEFHYVLTSREIEPRITLEGLLLDGRTGEVAFKTRGRLEGEFGLRVEAGTLGNNKYRLEDWVETDLRLQIERALERAVEKLRIRLEDDFFARPPTAPPAPGTR